MRGCYSDLPPVQFVFSRRSRRESHLHLVLANGRDRWPCEISCVGALRSLGTDKKALDGTFACCMSRPHQRKTIHAPNWQLVHPLAAQSFRWDMFFGDDRVPVGKE